jgi:thioredoxin reductase (NADPH)
MTKDQERFEILVVGAGPCGIAVGAAAARAGVSCALVDKGCITSSLINYPYYMTFFSTARMLEIGDVPFTIPTDKPTRRDALAYYRFVVRHWDMDVRQYEAVTRISGTQGDFTVHTLRSHGEERAYSAGAVVVATGGFHAPNLLEVPGEGLPKVLHYYKEPYPFYDQDVLVVGAGNSAVESALEMFRNGARVSMVHFLDTIDKGVKPWVVPDITNRLKNGEIAMHWRHRVAEVTPTSVVLRHVDTGATTEIKNDWVVAMTGWRPEPRLLKAQGVSIDGDTGIPAHDPATMATDVPGIYIAGVIAAGYNANKIFIENGREHGGRIVAHRLRTSPGAV